MIKLHGPENITLWESFDADLEVHVSELAGCGEFHIGHDSDGRPVQWTDQDTVALRPETGGEFIADDGIVYYASRDGWITDASSIMTYGERT